MPKNLLVFICTIFISLQTFGQCGSFISTFPYNQNFELSINGWNSGGISSDWAWGAPSKAFITNAGGGTNCWVTGGLGVGLYTNGQRSYVTSPCFDFTNVIYPFFSAKIYWESELSYDGTTFQYSTNSGATWINVGSVSNPTNCLNQNWFNSSNIQYLNTLANPKEGWSGSQATTCVSSNGSNGWVTAKHCLSNLAGLPNVQFRFAFGAGTYCNNFDGFAFDDVYIGEAPANNANFTSTCTGNVLEYSFNNTSALCPDSYTWNFGDASSGANNTSMIQNPTHIFSNPGTYIVTLTVSGPCNAPSTITKTITTINATVTGTNPLCSNSNNGSIQSIATNTSGLVSYTLQPNNTNNFTGNFNNLNANSYTVTILDGGNCAITKSINIAAPNPVIWNSVLPTNISCSGLQNGQINALANGGTGAINYNLNPGNIINTSGSFNMLSNITYTITATDANNCSISTLVNITQPNILSFSSFAKNNVQCFGQSNGNITAQVIGGSGTINYTILPSNVTNTSGNFNNLNAGTFTIICTDANGCSISSITSLTSPTEIIISNVATTKTKCNPNNTGSISITAFGGTGGLAFSITNGTNSSSNPTFNNLIENSYTILVSDTKGCTKSIIATIASETPPVFSNVNTINVTCKGETNGEIKADAIGFVLIQKYDLLPNNLTTNNGVFQNLTEGSYTVIATDINGCTVSQSISVQSPDELIIDKISLTSDSCGVGFKPSIIVITDGGNGNNQYRILPGGFINITGIFNQLNEGSYTITATDSKGCATSSIASIKERICCGDVFIPNAFTPNQDGRNDELKLLNTAGTELEQFYIFNRWGELVFSGITNAYGWDGKYKGVEAEIGTYFYQVKYKCLLSDKIYFKKGDVVLIR
jgi:gliding motility-associated-like protein